MTAPGLGSDGVRRSYLEDLLPENRFDYAVDPSVQVVGCTFTALEEGYWKKKPAEGTSDSHFLEIGVSYEVNFYFHIRDRVDLSRPIFCSFSGLKYHLIYNVADSLRTEECQIGAVVKTVIRLPPKVTPGPVRVAMGIKPWDLAKVLTVQFRGLQPKNLALGKQYRFNPQPDFPGSTNESDKVELTDNRLAKSLEECVCWNRANNVELILDLEKEYPISSPKASDCLEHSGSKRDRVA